MLLFGTLTYGWGFCIAQKARRLWMHAGQVAIALFARLMPEVAAWPPGPRPDDAELCGQCARLDNAATPMGLKAMRALQELNPRPDTATNARNSVPGAQRIVTHAAAGEHLHSHRMQQRGS